MNNTFEIKRFGNYLMHDIRAAIASCGLPLVIIGAMPVFQYFIPEAFSLLFTGHAMDMGDWGKIPAYLSAIVFAGIFFPAKHYGSLTDKRQGSDWLMLPASTFEKWFSMLLLTCVIVPVALLAELIVTDGLMSLIFSGTYGATAISAITAKIPAFWSEFSTDAGKLFISWPVAVWLSWCETVLFFAFGAMIFEKAKVVKTFLLAFGLGMVITAITAILMKIFGINGMHIDTSDFTEEGIIRTMNWIVFAVYFVWFAAQDAVLYIRMKTLKH